MPTREKIRMNCTKCGDRVYKGEKHKCKILYISQLQTKQEEIKEGIKTTILMNVETNAMGDVVFKVDGLGNVLAYLHSQGCVLKVDRELPKNPFDKSCGLNESAHNGFEVAGLKYKKAGYVAVEPLI